MTSLTVSDPPGVTSPASIDAEETASDPSIVNMVEDEPAEDTKE